MDSFSNERSLILFFKESYLLQDSTNFFSQKNEKYCQLFIYKIYERPASEREFFILIESGKVGCLQNFKPQSEDIGSNANLEKETKGTVGLVTEIET